MRSALALLLLGGSVAQAADSMGTTKTPEGVTAVVKTIKVDGIAGCERAENHFL